MSRNKQDNPTPFKTEEEICREAEEIAKKIESGEEELFPMELIERTLIGNEPIISVLGEWRGLRPERICYLAGISMEDYENAVKGEAPQKIYEKIAKVLHVPASLILP